MLLAFLLLRASWVAAGVGCAGRLEGGVQKECRVLSRPFIRECLPISEKSYPASVSSHCCFTTAGSVPSFPPFAVHLPPGCPFPSLLPFLDPSHFFFFLPSLSSLISFPLCISPSPPALLIPPFSLNPTICVIELGRLIWWPLLPWPPVSVAIKNCLRSCPILPFSRGGHDVHKMNLGMNSGPQPGGGAEWWGAGSQLSPTTLGKKLLPC